MATLSNNMGRVWFDDTEFLSIMGWSIDVDLGPPIVVDVDSAGYKNYMPGLMSWFGDVKYYSSGVDPIGSSKPGEKHFIRIRSSSQEYFGKIILTKIFWNYEEKSISFVGDEEIRVSLIGYKHTSTIKLVANRMEAIELEEFDRKTVPVISEKYVDVRLANIEIEGMDE